MIQCRAATQLLSRELDERLAFISRDALEAHLRICPACARCREQFWLLREMMQRLREHAG
jgi:predicted anti-sigma-YlaC factor YlaD